MQAEPEYAEMYTTKERIRIFAIGVVIGAMLVYLSKKWLLPWINEFTITAYCSEILGVDGLTLLWFGVFFGLPLQATILVILTFGWRGYKILRDGQNPPLKQKVMRTTVIQRGLKAKLAGCLNILTLVPFIVLTVWGVFQADKMSRTLHPKAAPCSPHPFILPGSK